MRRAALALTIILALPLTATATDCVTGTIDWVDGSPAWSPGPDVEGIRTAIVGTFLWVQYPTEPSQDESGAVSVELASDVVGASVCGDGIVTLDRTPDVSGPPLVVDLETLWGWWDPALNLRIGPR